MIAVSKRWTLLALAALTGMVSCSVKGEKEEMNANLPAQVEMVFEATNEGSGSKTAVQEDGASVWWTAHESISIFYSDAAGSKFMSTNDAPVARAQFKGTLNTLTGEVDESSPCDYWALYPYDPYASFDGTGIATSLSPYQKAAAETFADGQWPTLARSENMFLSFRAICAGFRCSFTREGVTSISFKGNNGEVLAGKFQVGMDGDSLPFVLDNITQENEVTLFAPVGQTLQTGTLYYLSFFPTDFAQGFTVTFRTETEKAVVVYGSAKEFKRTEVHRAINLDSGATYVAMSEDERNEYRQKQELVPGISKGAYKHVVIIGVDGAGAFFRDTDTPRCDEIFAGQATTYRSRMALPTMSAQGWASILHGVLPEFHGCTNTIIEEKPYPLYSPYPSVFRVVREAMPEAELASFVEWNPINIGVVENNLGVEKGTGADDAEVTGRILTYLRSKTPTLMFVQFSSPDDIGETYGFGTDIYLATISTADALVGRIYDQLKRNGVLDETLFIVTADHGGLNKSHGGDSDAEKYVFLGVAGKTVASGTIVEAEGRDVAAIAAYALGFDFPETWSGHVPAGVFKDVTEVGPRRETQIPGTKYRNHQTEPTPVPSQLESLLEGHDIVAYLPFDESISDAFGNVQTSQSGTLQYEDAYFGKGVALNNGYVTLKDVKVGTGSFSVAFWLKGSVVSPSAADPGLISNKDWQEGVYKGFILSYRGAKDVKFNVGDGNKNRMDFERTLPSNYNQGWMHVILTVDRPNRKVRVFYDFIDGDEAEIPAALANTSFDSLNLNIGQDGTGTLEYKLPARMDEFIMTSDVLTPADIAALKAYYEGN